MFWYLMRDNAACPPALPCESVVRILPRAEPEGCFFIPAKVLFGPHPVAPPPVPSCRIVCSSSFGCPPRPFVPLSPGGRMPVGTRVDPEKAEVHVESLESIAEFNHVYVNAAKRRAEGGEESLPPLRRRWIFLMDVIVNKVKVVGPAHKRDDRPPTARITPWKCMSCWRLGSLCPRRFPRQRRNLAHGDRAACR